MIPVEKYLDEQENKLVYMHVYSYYDKVLNQFNQPLIEDHDPQFMATSVRAGLLKGTFPADKAAGLQLIYLGTFCVNTGEFQLLKNGEIIVDCDRLLQKKEEIC